ncbi:MAG: phosphotransferase [bacterium]|nr:phosphotransferase [bacterium]
MRPLPAMTPHSAHPGGTSLHLGAGPGSDLDLGAVHRWLATDVAWPPGYRLGQVHLHRLWVGRHSRITFELRLQFDSPEGAPAALLQGGLGTRPKRHRPARQARLDHDWLQGLCLWNEALGVCICSPDCDPYLPAVHQHLPTGAVTGAPADGRLSPDGPEQRLATRLIAYRTGKRCVLRARRSDGDAPGVFLKFFRRLPAGSSGDRYHRVSTALVRTSRGAVRIPELTTVDEQCRMLVLAEVADARPIGLNLDDLLAAANTLTALHRVPIEATAVHSPDTELDTARRWVDVIRGLSPGLDAPLRRLIAALDEAATRLTYTNLRLIHRDFYGAQLLRAGDTVWLVDFDTLCRGHAELDVATFLAHLLLDLVRQGDASPSLAAVWGERFTDAYQSTAGRLDP